MTDTYDRERARQALLNKGREGRVRHNNASDQNKLSIDHEPPVYGSDDFRPDETSSGMTDGEETKKRTYSKEAEKNSFFSETTNKTISVDDVYVPEKNSAQIAEGTDGTQSKASEENAYKGRTLGDRDTRDTTAHEHVIPSRRKTAETAMNSSPMLGRKNKLYRFHTVNSSKNTKGLGNFADSTAKQTQSSESSPFADDVSAQHIPKKESVNEPFSEPASNTDQDRQEQQNYDNRETSRDKQSTKQQKTLMKMMLLP